MDWRKCDYSLSGGPVYRSKNNGRALTGMPRLKIVAMALVVVASGQISGCATITTGTTQSLTVDTMNATEARCKGVDNKGREYHWVSTPCSTTVQKGDAPLVITCEKAGFKKTAQVVEEYFQGATLGNIILGGGVGIIIDAASGGAQRYPDVVKLPIEPEDSAPEELKQAYLASKQQLADEQKKKEEEEQAKRNARPGL